MKRGFTLIELLVVIAIIAILAAILFPVFARAREKARQSACLSNVKQISLAIQMYANDYDDRIPFMLTWDPDGTPNAVAWWWQVTEPYIKNTQVWKCPSQGDRTPSEYSHYHYTYPRMPYLGHQASSQERAHLSYWKYPAETMIFCCTRPDGPGSSAAYSYISYAASHWVDPYTGHVGTVHNNGSNVGFMDGHAKWLNINTFRDTTTTGQKLWGHYNS